MKGSFDKIADNKRRASKILEDVVEPAEARAALESVAGTASANPLALSVAEAFIGGLNYAVCGHPRPADAIKQHRVHGRRCRQVGYRGTSRSRNRHAVERSERIPDTQHDDRCQWAILFFERSSG